jgi:hypothetical protein
MRTLRPSTALWVFVGLSILQPVLFVLVGALHHPNTRGIVIIAGLVVALAFRSRVAWVLLILVDGIPLLASMAFIGGSRVQWSHLVMMVLTGVCLETTLLSQPMRQYVRRTPGHRRMPMPSQ